MSKNILLESERLQLYKFSDADIDFIIELVNSPGWLINIGDRNIHNSEQALKYIQDGPIKSYAENGYGLCKVVLKESGLAIGNAGLLKRSSDSLPEIGYAFLPDYYNKEYASEITEAICKYAFQTLAFEVLTAKVLHTNVHSIRILEKLGMRRLDTTEDKGEILYVYAIKRDDYFLKFST